MSNVKKNIFVFTFTCILTGASSAATFPHGCEVSGFGFSENNLVLNETGEQTFYLIQNRSNTTIELIRHETRDVFMSPQLQSKLAPSNWAAFASDVENLNFKCYAQQENNTAMVNCSDVLEVCQYPRVKFALSNMGNYWVSTNKPQGQVIKDAIAKGILLRW